MPDETDRFTALGSDDPLVKWGSITRDDVEFLRLVSGQWRALRLGPHQQGEFDRIVDRIAALLPPES